MANQTVIINQPGANYGGAPRQWNHGLCGCFDDFGDCCFWYLCPCCYECSMVQSAGETCCIMCCVPGWSIALRTKIRTIGNIEGSICNDCMMLYFCGPCATCQMKREWDDIRSGRV